MESIRNATSLGIEEETQVAAARRAAAELGRRLGLADATIARAELVAVELAGNILHHAGRGRMYLAPAAGGDGLQVIASDLGPGLGDVERAMQDGYSTRTTPGLGLGAVKRQADALDVYTRHDAGTVVSAILCDDGPPISDAAVISVPIEGELVNGDAWSIARLPERTVYLMADGLGHGHYAFEASTAVLRVAEAALAQDPQMPLTTMMQRMHLPMQATRGAAVMLISIAKTVADGVATQEVLCCGVGNISAVLCAADGTTRALVSHNGTVGHRMARVQEFAYPVSPGTVLVMHSDGISTKWKLSQYPGVLQHAPATIAALIYRDSVRGRDDATVLVARTDVAASVQPGGQGD